MSKLNRIYKVNFRAQPDFNFEQISRQFNKNLSKAHHNYAHLDIFSARLLQFIRFSNPNTELDITQEDIRAYLVKVKMTAEAKQNLVNKEFVNRIEMNLKCNTLCLIQPDISEHPVHKWLFPLSEKEKTQVSYFVKRLIKICDMAKETGTSIIVDAEQTYLQKFIDCLGEQLQFIYNYKQTQRGLVINTIQVFQILIFLY